jgi:cytochrome c553
VNLTIQLVIGVALAGVLQPVIAQPADADAKAKDIAMKVCSECHGPTGESVNPKYPNLAAQQPIYFENQLKAFRNHTRSGLDAQHIMLGKAERILEEMLAGAMARYYASQPAPKPVAGDPTLIAKGKELYQSGSAAHQVPACIACHGPNASGSGIFPRLAGQHKEYLLKQLQLIQSTVRKSPVMHGNIEHLDQNDMPALAVYLQSLN